MICSRCNTESDRRGGRGVNAKLCWDCVGQTDKDPIRRRARQHVVKAVRRGLLPPPKELKCKDCGNPEFCYDHRDYRWPLLIEPVCKSCDSFRGPGLPHLPNRHGIRKDWYSQRAA